MRYDRVKRLTMLLALVLVSVMVVGCASKGEVEILNDDLSGRIDVKKLKNRSVGDLLQAQVKIKNKSKTDQRFRLKFVWFDKQGFEIDSEAASWKPVLLHGKEEKTLQGVAPNASVKKYKVLIR